MLGSGEFAGRALIASVLGAGALGGSGLGAGALGACVLGASMLGAGALGGGSLVPSNENGRPGACPTGRDFGACEDAS